MATKDLHNNIKVVQAIAPVSVADNTAQVSAIIDLQDFESAEFIISAGSLGTAAATFTPTIDEGDAANLSDAAAVAATDLIGTLTAFDGNADNTIYKIGYVGSKRYIRLTITPASNASAALLSAEAVLSHARHAPVA